MLASKVDESVFENDAEKGLFEELRETESKTEPLFTAGDYTPGLADLAKLKDPLDAFFDDVLVMCENKSVQSNRLALLQRLRDVFLKVADISFLHTT